MVKNVLNERTYFRVTWVVFTVIFGLSLTPGCKDVEEKKSHENETVKLDVEEKKSHENETVKLIETHWGGSQTL